MATQVNSEFSLSGNGEGRALHPQGIPSEYKQYGLSDQQRKEVRQVVREQLDITFGGDIKQQAPPAIESLYSELQEASRLRTVLDLLDQALRCAASALESAGDDDVFGADDELAKLSAILPELFCSRGIGDGYAAVVNSVRQALLNRHGKPVDSSQVTAIWRALSFVRQQPFLTFIDAVKLISKIERTGLDIDHPVIGILLEDAESIS